MAIPPAAADMAAGEADRLDQMLGGCDAAAAIIGGLMRNG
jgi:hypothetical protein